MKHFKKILPICIILAGIILCPRAAFGLQKIVYSDSGVISGAVVWTWDSFRRWTIGTAEATFNGKYIGGIPVDPNTCFQTISNHGNTYAGWGVFKNEDMSSYAGGYLKFWVKTWNNLKVEIKDSSNHHKYISAYGWTSGDAGTWKEITIPINDFGASLASITGLFLVTVDGANLTFYIDYVRWTDTDVQTLNQIKVFPQQSTLAIGDQKELIALGYDIDGDLMDITPDWSIVSGPGVGEIVSVNGNRIIFQGNDVGGATIRASVDTIEGFADINVTTSDRTMLLSYNIYSDAGLPTGVTSIPQMPGGPPDPTCTEIESGAPEGTKYYKTEIGSSGWGGWWIELPQAGDFKDYESGSIKFFARASVDLVVKLKGGDIESGEKVLTTYGWSSNNTWQEVIIPLVDFALDGVDFSSMQNVFLVSTFGEPGQGTIYSIDNVRYETLYALPPPSRIVISGTQLLIDDVPFTIKGVCYSPTPVGEGYQTFDISQHPEIYERDFRLLKAMGANTIRIYKPPTTIDFMDAAFNQGLYVIMDYSVAHNSDLNNPAVLDAIKTGFLNMVNTWKNHPAVLMWNLGNEINFHLNGAHPSVWYSFVNDCAGEAHLAEGAEYHPVISANAEIAEIGQAAYSADDGSLPYLDAWAVQIYRGQSFGSMFTDLKTKTSKPVVITEFGCDAFDMRNQREEEQQQAIYLQSQLGEIENKASADNLSNICIGGTVFMWADNWSKSQWGWPDSVHDTDGLWSSPAYYDWENSSICNMNEEWWGICGISPGTTDRQLRKAYFTIQSMWRATPLMSVHVNGGNHLTWSGVIAGQNVWKVADHPITIEADDAFEDNFDVWGIQIFTDNTSADALPRYTGDTSKSFNLVSNTDTTQGLALCWKITDGIMDPGVPVWLEDRGDETEGFTDYQWRWMKDAGQMNYPFVPGEEYVRGWDQDGIYWADHVGDDVDPFIPGAQPCPAPAASPNYIYVGVQLHDSLAQQYSTNKLVVEFIFP